MTHNKYHKLLDASAIIAIVSLIASVLWYFAHEHAKVEYMVSQVTEIKDTQNKLDDKIDKIYEIVTDENIIHEHHR